MDNKKKTNGTMLRSALIAVCIVLGLVFAVMLGCTVYAEYLLSKVNYVDPNATVPTLSQEEIEALHRETETMDPDFTGPELKEEDVELETAAQVEVDKENVVNILLIGADYQSGDIARSDSMILCTFNKHTNTITLTSIMRDMYVKIPGYKSNRINVAYTFGGMQLLNRTISQNFGVEADGIVEIDFSNFEKLIDLLGGIELELNTKEANYINYKAGSQLKAGVQTLNGKEALWYSRFRKDASGDFGRTNRQRIVLTILLNRYKDLSLPELIGMMDDILPMVTTNMTKDEILNHVTNLFPMLAGAEIVTQRIPVEGAYYQAKINDMAVLVPNISKNARILQDVMYEPPAQTEDPFAGGVG